MKWIVGTQVLCALSQLPFILFTEEPRLINVVSFFFICAVTLLTIGFDLWRTRNR